MRRRALIGRQAELQVLAEAIEDAQSGHGGLVLLAGEPGIGKTRLVEEAARLAAARGTLAVWGRCWEAGGAAPYWPWIQVLRVLLRERKVPAPPELGRLLPELGGSAPATASLEPGPERFRLFDAVARYLVEAARGGPLLVALDDLHAADRPSLLMLELVAGNLSGAGLLIAGTYREAEARRTPELGEALARLGRVGQTLRLNRLDRTESAELVARESPVPLDERTLARLCEAGEGNPLFMTELVRLVGTRPPAPDRPLPIPDGVREAIRERIVGLPAAARAPLEVAAVLGRELSVTTLAQVLGRPAVELVDLLAHAQRAGILVEPSPARFAFAHGLFREILHADLPPARRGELHLATADTLERLHAGDPAAPLAEIAHHLLQAGPSTTARAIGAARRAAERAARHLAFEEAASFLERAVEALASALPADTGARCDLLIDLADARVKAGDFERGKEACRAAARLARDLGHGERLARAALVYGAHITPNFTDPALVELLEEALARLPDEPGPLRARALARLAGAKQPARNPEEPVALARRAIAMARDLGDPQTLLVVLHGAMAAFMDYVDPQERLPLNEETVRLAGQLGEPTLAMRARLRLVADHYDLGNLEAADEQVRAYQDLSGELRVPQRRWLLPMLAAMRALLEGRQAEYERELAEARRGAEATNDPSAGRTLQFHGVFADYCRERHREMRARLDEIQRILGVPFYGVAVAALTHARAGEVPEAQAALDRIAATDVHPAWILVIAHYLAEAAFETLDAAWAARLFELALPVASRTGCTLFAMVVLPPMEKVLTLCAALLGRMEDARRHHQAAVARARKMGARPWLARLEYEWAVALLRHGRAEDAEEARRCLAEARGLAGALGLDELVARIAAEEERAATPAPTAAVAMTLEGEYWSVSGGEGERCRMKDSRGLRILAQLVGQPGRELHVLELLGGDGPIDAGDAGEEIDREARDAYRARLGELRDELEEAEAWNDPGRAERARREAEALQTELSRAVGLGGRERRAGRAAERARVNVQRRVADAIRHLRAAAPNLGQHLEKAIKTGAFCSYLPERADR